MLRPRPRPFSCDGPNRRDLLRIGTLGALGLGLDDFWRGRALAAPTGRAIGAGKAQACILVWLAGGPSHLDTFDPKPKAPADIRGEFAAIDTAIPGVQLSQVLPELAKVLDRAVLVRSMTSPEAEHDRATHHLLTGYRPSPALVYPSHGSVVARTRADRDSTLPPYVAVPDAPAFASSGYLTPAYDPFSVGGDPNAANFRIRDLNPPDRLTLDRLKRRRGMVRALDDFAASDLAATPLTGARDQFAERAYELLTSSAAQEAFRIGAEAEPTRDRYGRTPVGQALLLARRLVERGVPFVTVNDRVGGPVGWDTHAQNFPAIRDTLAPPVDRGVAALIGDLEARGLLDTTLVVLMGEFGRTPKINGAAGRDHHGRASSVLLAGGGLPRGLVLGRTDDRGDAPAERPISPADLAATLFTALGIDPETQYPSPDGRPIRLVDGGAPIAELL